MKIIVILVLISIITISCTSDEILWLYSPDKSKCITAIDRNKIKYIFTKKVSSLEEGRSLREFAELDIKNVTQMGHGMFVCWNDSNKLLINCPEAIIVTNTFNTNEVEILTSLERLNGIPTALRYHQNNCFEFGYYGPHKIFPEGNGTYEFK